MNSLSETSSLAPLAFSRGIHDLYFSLPTANNAGLALLLSCSVAIGAFYFTGTFGVLFTSPFASAI